MDNNSNSDDQGNTIELSKSAPKKAKGRKDPNRRIADSAEKYAKLARQIYPYEDMMKKASLAYDLELKMRGTYDVIKIMEDSMRISDQMNSIARFEMPGMAGLNTIGEAVKLASERARDVIESIARFPMDQLNRYQEMMNNSVYFRPLEDIIGDFSEKYAWMDALRISPIEHILKDIDGIHNITLKDIFKISSEMKDFYANLPDDEISLQDDKNIVCAGKTYDISDITDLVDETIEKTGFSEDNKISRKDLENFFSEIKKIKDTCLQKILWHILVPLLLAIINILANNYYHDSSVFISRHKNEIIKIIDQEIQKNVVDKTALKDYRLITANVLFVRKSNYQRSELIGQLYLGSIVRVIQKKKDWTLIVWEDKDNDLIIRGWVFSRYLKKF